MENICKEHINQVSNDLAQKLISLGSSELTQSSDVIPDWQTAASNLLSTLGMRYAKEVLQELLTKLQAGQLPHFFVVSTIGQLATTNGTTNYHDGWKLYSVPCTCIHKGVMN
jgi:hypothetical protein